MIAKKFMLAAAIAAAAVTLHAQPAITYKKAFGGTWYDYAAEIKATADSGMVLLGLPMSGDGDLSGNYGWSDAWVVKLDATGNIEWKKNYGGSNSDGATSISPTSDGGYIFAGYSTSNDYDLPSTNSDNNLWVAKIDPMGVLQWSKVFGGSDYEYASSVFELADGTYLVGGSTNSTDGDVSGPHKGDRDCWVLKLDANGNLLWEKSYGGSSYESITRLIPTADGGAAFLAYTQSEFPQASNGDVTGHHGGWGDMWLVKLDASGNIQWSKCYGGSSGENPGDLLQTASGDLVMLGMSASQDGDAIFTSSVDSGGCWIAKLDNAGNMLWEVKHGATAVSGTGITEDADGNYVIIATSTDNGPDVSGYFGAPYKGDYWVMSMDSQGALMWQDSYGGNDTEAGRSITVTRDGSIAILGEAASNNNGEVSGSGYHYGTETIHPPNSPSFTVNTCDLWVLKITPPSSTGMKDEATGISINVFPNPSSESITVSAALHSKGTILITDMAGRAVHTEVLQNGIIRKNIKVSDWAPGVYNVKLVSQAGVSVVKFIVAGS